MPLPDLNKTTFFSCLIFAMILIGKEVLYVVCLHDFDAFGTIHHTFAPIRPHF